MVQKIQVDAKTIVAGRSTNILSGMGKMLAREAVISGYGAISETDIGHVMTNTYDGYETIRSFAAPALAQEAKYSAFAVFRDAIAEAAENPMEYANSVKQVANGQNYTNFYADLLSGQKMIEGDLLTSAPDSIESKLNYYDLDWNDPTARAEYLSNIQEYANQTGLRDHAGFVQGKEMAGADELKILLHTSSTEEYTRYIQQYESAIQANFQEQLKAAQEHAKDLGYTGSMTNTKAMEKFAATLSGADKGAMDSLIKMTDGKINKVDQYLLARVASGQIDVQEIIAGNPAKGIPPGTLNGVQLDQKALHALAALNVFAHSDSIASAYQEQILSKIGGTTELHSIDLNSMKQVSIRCKEFEDALAKHGLGAFQKDGGVFAIASKANKKGVVKGIGLQHMTMKQLRNIDLSKIQNKDVRAALKQYINLREHKDTLAAAKELMGNMQMRITQMTRKILGDSDLSNAIGQIQSQYRNVQYAMKIWVKLGQFAKWVGKTSRKLHVKFDNTKLQKLLKGKNYDAYMNSSKSGRGRQQAHDKKMADKKAKTKAKNAKKANAKQAKVDKLKTTKRGQKKLARNAKKAEKKLLKKAGKQGGKWIRSAGRLAKHGAMGTTAATGSGAAAAGAGGSAAAGAGGSAAAGAGGSAAGGAAAGAGGVSAGVVCFWIILIVVIVAAVCAILSGAINVIISSATEFDNTLIGKMVNWIADFKWPWEASDEQKENVLWYTMLTLQEEEIKNKNAGNILGDGVFRGGYAPYKAGTEKNPEYVDDDDAMSKISWMKTEWNQSNMPTADTYYVYTNAETGAPINEFTNIKLCLSMAHAFTYQIQYKSDINDFSTYAVGLWNYLNKHTVTAILSMCEGCGTFEYDCRFDWECPKGCETPCSHKKAEWDSSYYGDIYLHGLVYKTSPGAKINISVNNNNKFYVVNGYTEAHTDRGCMKTYHDNVTGKVTITDTLYLGRGSTKQSTVVKLSSLQTEDGTPGFAGGIPSYDKLFTASAYYGNSSGGVLKWNADPAGLQECFADFFILRDSDIHYHTGGTTSISGSCNNMATLDTYKKVENWKYHGTKRAGSSSINTSFSYSVGSGNRDVYLTTSRNCASGYSHSSAREYYQCKGHSEKVYCSAYSSTYTYTTSYSYNSTLKKYVPGTSKTQEHASLVPCSCGQNKSRTVYLVQGNLSSKPSKVPIYYCDGHTNHGVFDSSSDYFDDCRHYVPPVYDDEGKLVKSGEWVKDYTTYGTYYICSGYKVITYEKSTTKYYACLGHLKCDYHYSCPDHELTYCKGHISYQIERKSIMSNSDAIYSDSWTHTVKGKFLWWETEETFSPKKDAPSGQTSLARSNWAGWTEDNIELMKTIYADDWYLKYNVGLGTFVGSECSAVEQSRIKETFNITSMTTTQELMANVDWALDACGKICYYPGDQAKTGGYASTNKFNTTATKVFDKNNVQRGVHGLDPKYFADWVYRSTHDNAVSPYLTTSMSQNTYSVDAHTKSGTLIVNTTDSNNIRTGVLLGTFVDSEGVRQLRYVGIDTGSETGGGWVTVITEPCSGWRYTTLTQN